MVRIINVINTLVTTLTVLSLWIISCGCALEYLGSSVVGLLYASLCGVGGGKTEKHLSLLLIEEMTTKEQ